MATNVTAPTTGDLLTVPSGVARLHYFFGQLLTQRDMNAEQRYQIELRRLMQRETFGTGTVAGLRVEDAGAGTQGGLYVRAGLAMDPDGRELLLVNDVCVNVADPALTPSATAYVPGPYDRTSIANAVSQAWNSVFGPNDIWGGTDPGTSNDRDALANRLAAVGLTELTGDELDNFPNLARQLNKITVQPGFSLQAGQLLRDVIFDALVGTTYLGLRYVERGTEPAPTVLDASCCGDASCSPSRIEEGVVLVAQSTPFPHVPDPFRRAVDLLSHCFLPQEQLQEVKEPAPPPVKEPEPKPVKNPQPTPVKGEAPKAEAKPQAAPAQPDAAKAKAQAPEQPAQPIPKEPQPQPIPKEPQPQPIPKEPQPKPFPKQPEPAHHNHNTGLFKVDCRACLCDYLLDAWRGLPASDPCAAAAYPVVPLARIYWSRFPRETAGQSRILSIDNCDRPFAPGVPPVRALLAVLTQCTTTAPTPPRFDQATPPNGAVLTPDAGGQTATVSARATTLLAPLTASTWEVYFYPVNPASTPATPAYWTWGSPPDPAFNLAITLQASQVPSPTDPTQQVTAAQLVFSAAQAGSSFQMPSGTYLWRMNVDGGLQAASNSVSIPDIFEAVFYVP